MVTYKEKVENKHTWVLSEGGKVLSTYGNLKTLIESVNDPGLPSYHTLVRKKDFPLAFGKYQIWYVKHYTGKHSNIVS